MDFTSYTGLKDNAKTVFVCGVTAALSVDIASDTQKLQWIQEELKKMEEELTKLDAEYDATDEVGDPFVEVEVI